jgi:AcrR family transcriptional regulator
VAGAVRKSGETAPQRRFLDVAAELFARHGYHATSIRDIARALGVTPGAVYAHFASKSGILLAVYEEGVRQVSEAVDGAAGAGKTPWAALEEACRRHLEALLADSGYARVVIRVLPSDVPDVARELTALRDGYEARFRRLIEALELAPKTDRGLLRLTLLGALNGTQVRYRPGKADPAAIARTLVRSLRQGTERKGKER